MLKLKKIILDLSATDFVNLEQHLHDSKSGQSLQLLRHYRSNNKQDTELMKELAINSNSFYVLKSRLYDKIQSLISGNLQSNKDDVLRLLHHISDFCYSNPRETSIAFLEKLEQELSQFHMHNELLVVYNALKKMHAFNQKYYHYSQLYNKQIAYSLSIEKSEEILCNFNRLLAQYNFDRLERTRDALLFVRKEIADHYELNPSRQIEIIKNLIDAQLILFCETELKDKIHTENLLHSTQLLFNQLPEQSPFRLYEASLHFLLFEFYFRNNLSLQAADYFTRVNSSLSILLLQTHVAPNALFLHSRLHYLQKTKAGNNWCQEVDGLVLYDPKDMHSEVLINYHTALQLYFNHRTKDAISMVNSILNTNSFKDYFHIQIELKLCLAYFYLSSKEFDMADHIIKNLARKIKNEKLLRYQNVLDLIKLFSSLIKEGSTRIQPKHADLLTLFIARNKNENKVLECLSYELKSKLNATN